MRRRKVIPSLIATLGVPLICRIAQQRYHRIGESWDAGDAQGQELTVWLRRYVVHVGVYSHAQLLVGIGLYDKLLRQEAQGWSTLRESRPAGQLQFRGFPIIRGFPITIDSLLGANQVQMARL